METASLKREREEEVTTPQKTLKSDEGSNTNAQGKPVVWSMQGYVCGNKGPRRVLEDVEVLHPNLAAAVPDAPAAAAGGGAFFAIYDGHGGRVVAEVVRDRLHGHIIRAVTTPTNFDDVRKGIQEGYKKMDAEIRDEGSEKKGNWKDGCTAVTALLLHGNLYISNIGDAKAVLCRRAEAGAAEASPPAAAASSPTVTPSTAGVTAAPKASASAASPAAATASSSHADATAYLATTGYKALQVTKDHKAIFIKERQRIEKAGGFVENGRVNGMLEVSRAFGDVSLKKFGVSAVPETQRIPVSDRDRFLLLGCDGLWGVFRKDEAVAFVLKRLDQAKAQAKADGDAAAIAGGATNGGSAGGVSGVHGAGGGSDDVNYVPSASVCQDIVKALVREALYERESQDNVTAMLLFFTKA